MNETNVVVEVHDVHEDEHGNQKSQHFGVMSVVAPIASAQEASRLGILLKYFSAKVLDASDDGTAACVFVGHVVVRLN
jgi:hypothetical protein